MAYPSVSYTFTNGTVADGANVSTNFSNLVSGLSDGTKDLNMNAATFAGNLTANGNIVLGNASSDTLSFTGAITLGLLSTLTMAVGAAATPSLNFTSSLTTGLSCAAADTLIISTAATARMTFSSTGTIGVFTTPAERFHIHGVTTNGSAVTALALTQGGSGSGTGTSLKIGYNTTTGTYTQISGFFDGAGTSMTFATAESAGSTAVTERMRIDGKGNVGFGVTPSAWSGVNPFDIGIGSMNGGAYSTSISNGAYYNGSSWVYKSSSVAPVDFLLSSGYWYFRNAAVGTAGNTFSYTTRLTVQSDGILALTAGIKFPATINESADVNTLDDYEEGTWTPSPSASTPGGTPPTFGTCTGHYTKIGNTVHLKCVIPITANGTGSGEILVANMPFAVGGSGYSTAYGRETASTGKMLQGYANATGTTIHVINYDNTYPGGTGYSLSVHMTYIV